MAVGKPGCVSKPRGQQCLSQDLKRVRHIKLKMVIETLPTWKGHNHYFEEQVTCHLVDAWERKNERKDE